MREITNKKQIKVHKIISGNDDCHGEKKPTDVIMMGLGEPPAPDWVVVGGLSDEAAFESSPNRQRVSHVKRGGKMS